MHESQEGHVIPARLYIMVWMALVFLTGITLGVSYIDMKNVAIITALLIATVKASLVLLYFMHIRFEKPIFFFMILAVLITYGIFIGLTFVDYAYR